MTAGLQITKAVAYFQPSLSHGSWNITQLRVGKPAEGCLRASFPFLNLSSTPPHSQTPLVSLLLPLYVIQLVIPDPKNNGELDHLVSLTSDSCHKRVYLGASLK